MTWCRLWIDLKLAFAWGIEIDLVLVRGSHLTLLSRVGRKLLWYNVWVEINTVFSVGIAIYLVFACGSKMTFF